MKKRLRRCITLLCCFCMVVNTLFPMQVAASKDKSAIYVSDYRKWSQGSSAYSEVRKVGCRIVAQAKLLREAGVDTTINPDTWYEYLWNNGGLVAPPTNLTMTVKGNALPEKYAAAKGKKLEYLGFWKATDDQLWFNIRAGYYTIVGVKDGGHWVMVDNKTSLEKGSIYIYDSYSATIATNQTTYNKGSHLLSDYSGSRPGGLVYKSTATVVVKPDTPTNVALSKTDIGLGEALTASWNSVANATGYNVTLTCTTNSAYNQTKTVGGTSASFSITNPGTYRVSVAAVNTAGTSGTANTGNCVVHENITVAYVDTDGTVISEQSIRYGGDATPPTAPAKEGYTFSSWSSDGKNLKSDTTITAKYTINSYTVSFLDYKGDVIGNIQKVNYGSEAKAPAKENIPVEEGYVFTGWNIDDYQNVKKNTIVQAVYAWENANLPIVTTITSAKRNEESTGYDVSVSMKNFPDDFTKGKLVVALKTKEGKQVASEIRSISMPSTGTATEDITVLYSGIVSTVEVSMIGLLDDDTTGTPKSKAVTATIDLGNEWSDWSTSVPEGEEVTESRTEYRYRDTKTIKAVSTPSTPDGYELISSSNIDEYTSYGNWSAWSTASVASSSLVNVENTTGYRYYGFRCKSCGTQDPYSGTCSNCGGSVYWVESWGTCKGTAYSSGYTKVNSTKGKIWWNSRWWYFEFDGCSDGQGGYGQPTTTLYRYRTRQQYKNYVYTQKEFSDWQAEKVTEGVQSDSSITREVETRTTFRFRSNKLEQTCYNYKRYKYENVNSGKIVYTYSSKYADSMDYPGEWEYKKSFTELDVVSTGDEVPVYNGIGEASWYRADVNEEGTSTVYITESTMEDTSGETRTVTGTLEGGAGKVATLMVYKGNNVDPIASQIEYIGQTTIDADGAYSFTYITKEEPTSKTGDFIIALGVEGATNYITLGKIEAPKAVYTVDFIDDDGNYIGEQKKVTAGGIVEAPIALEKEGYTFLGWDTGLKNIQENTVITAQYVKNKYQVIFVDWDSSSVHVQEYEYGDVLTTDIIPEQEGKRFDKWQDENGKEVITVTSNMILEASYVDATYRIVFKGFDGNIISEQELSYGETATIPDYTESPSAVQVLKTWDNLDAVSFVRTSVSLTPVYTYKDQAQAPQFEVILKEESGAKRVFIYSEDSEATIYYKVINGIDQETEGVVTGEEYEGYAKYNGTPITVESDSIVYAYAVSENTSDSKIVAQEVTIDKTEKKDITGFQAKLAQSSYTYNGKAKKPNVTISGLTKNVDYTVAYSNNKAVGTAKVVITGIGAYKGTITKTFKINPKKPAIKSLTVGKKKLIVKTKAKPSTMAGSAYQIAYKQKGSKTWKYKTTTSSSVTIKKLKKGKRYYIKVRAYKKVGKVTYYGSWTASKLSKKIK